MSISYDLLLIDGFSLLYRAYYGYPPNLTTPKGVQINAVYGFITLMLNAIKQFNPTYFGICLDRKEPTYRHQIFPDYKANRSAPDDEFLIQIPEFKRIISSFDVPLLEMPGYESDDLLGALSSKFSAQGIQTLIMSGDMDLLQLVNEKTHIVMNKKGVSNYVIYDLAELKEKYELTPQQFIDFKALKGDASDNIPGVRGVGEKTALGLLKSFDNLDKIYENIDNISSKSVKSKLIDAKDMAYLSKRLVTIDCEAPVNIALDSFLFQPQWQNVIDMFSEYEFKRLIDRVGDFSDVKPENTVLDQPLNDVSYIKSSFQVIQTDSKLDQLIPLLKDGFAFDLETTSLDPRDANIVAISITCSKGISFVLDCRDTELSGELTLFDDQKSVHPFINRLKPLLERDDVPKILHNAKYEYQVLAGYNIHLDGVYFDTMIAAHLLNYNSIGLKFLAMDCFNFQMLEFDELLKGHDSILDVPFDMLASYAADDTNVTYHLYLLFSEMLDKDQSKLFFEIEMPLIGVLANMEQVGVQCDIQYLQQLSKDYHVSLDGFKNKIYDLANNNEFNLNSTQQLAEVLFDQMGLPVIKKTKTSRSTDSSVLEKLSKDYPIANEILNYRSYKKLLSTYIDRLPELIHPQTQKIHTSFNQAVTATGRLSSNHPNLQNIPIRSQEGQKIRCAFISRFDSNGCILAVDYSQIELRVLAHLADDSQMIQAFLNGEDIHQSTAAKIFNTPYENVTKRQREQAKTVNFGITYGQSAFALAEQLEISRTEA
ncbi:MAG: DNA polymerase I, partial [Candidatus Margulisiibacteriota bacterium]